MPHRQKHLWLHRKVCGSRQLFQRFFRRPDPISHPPGRDHKNQPILSYKLMSHKTCILLVHLSMGYPARRTPFSVRYALRSKAGGEILARATTGSWAMPGTLAATGFIGMAIMVTPALRQAMHLSKGR